MRVCSATVLMHIFTERQVILDLISLPSLVSYHGGDVIDVPGRRDLGSYPSSIRAIISDIIIKVGGGGRGDLALREATEERDQAYAHLVRAWSIPHRVASAKSKFLENSR